MNQFDFYYIEARSKSVRELTRAGIKRSAIKTLVVGRRVYGRRTYPDKIHVATVWYGGTDVGEAERRLQEWQAKGVAVSLKYHAAD